MRTHYILGYKRFKRLEVDLHSHSVLSIIRFVLDRFIDICIVDIVVMKLDRMPVMLYPFSAPIVRILEIPVILC